jgi:hypothetical protein
VKTRDWIYQHLLGGTLHFPSFTDKGKVERFLRSVHPVTTEHPLVRLGGPSDGGYLVPDDLAGIRTCFSPGVSTTADFEEAMARRGVRSFMADHSVEGPPMENPLFHFEKKHLGPRDDEVFMTLRSWVGRHAPDEDDLILQMDIEGDEYGVILSTPRDLFRRFRILVIEFHALDTLVERSGFQLISQAFAHLLADFDVVHAHPNNHAPARRVHGFELPSVIEFTFHRKDRSMRRSPTSAFPHPHDRPNRPGHPDPALPACWRRAD